MLTCQRSTFRLHLLLVAALASVSVRALHAQATAGQVVTGAQSAAQEATGKAKPAQTDAAIGSKDSPSKEKTPAGQDKNPSGQDQNSPAKPAVAAGESSASDTKLRLGPTDPGPPPTALPHNRPVIGLAMGGGAALAMSEIGTLQWLEEHHIPVDVIAGTSMGSILAALYSTGKSPEQMKHILTRDNVNQVFRIGRDYAALNYRSREDTHEIPAGLGIGVRHGVGLRNSLLTDTGLNELLDREFLRYNDQTDFNNLPIPFRCDATDLTDAKTVVFARGSLQDAVRASASIPGVFRPFDMNGHEFVDGAILHNLPTPEVKAMKADVVIAVSLPLGKVGKGDLDSILGVLQRAFAVGIEANEAQERKLANVVIMPDVSKFTASDYLKTDELAKQGYAAAEAQKDELLRYAVSDAEWDAYMAAKKAKERPPAGNVIQVKVNAPTPQVAAVVHTIFNPVLGKPADTDQIEKLLGEVRADGRYDADYTVGYANPESNDPIVLVDVQNKKTGPPFLDLGFDLQAQTGGITRATVATILRYQDLGGYGSGLKVNIDLGFLTRLQGEYYWKPRPLGNYFVAPRLGLTRQPYFIYQNDYRLSERQSQFAGMAVDAGWTDGKYQELRVGPDFENAQWLVTTGADGLPNYGGNSVLTRARYVYDNQDRALVPHSGERIVLNGGYLNASPGPGAPRFTADLEWAHAVSAKDTILLNAEAGTFFNSAVPQPFRFTLGGPLRLAASAIDQYRGTDYWLVTPGYLHRIRVLPAPLGNSIYVGGTVEAGQMRSPEGRTITREDFYFGLVAETPFGVITIAPAIGTNNEHKFTFTLGRFF